MPRLLLLALLPACVFGTDDTGEPKTCEDVVASFQADLATAQACTTWDECGEVLQGTSCGCTHDLVVRRDADVAGLTALLESASEQSCDLGLVSDCDCPAAYGFDCVEGTCAWDYAAGTWLPDCQGERGDSYDVHGLVVRGDDLLVSVGYGGGCKTHTFTLCWPDGTFLESHPVQVNLDLFHDDGDDECDAWLKEEVTVSLAPLKAAWQAAYADKRGTITVHLGGQSVDYTF